MKKKGGDDVFEKIMKEVLISDDNHIWIDGKQFVSLKRFLELRNSESNEMQLLSDKVEELTSENDSLKKLLKVSL